MTVVLGLDPGVTGALAIVEGTQALVLEELPVLKVGTAMSRQRRDLDLAEIHKFLVPIAGAIDHAFVEKVSARPGQGVTSMFRFGYASGSLHGLLVALGIPLTFVAPQTWQKAMGVGPGGDAARARAKELYPASQASFTRKADEHRADAVLIATYGHDIVQRRLTKAA